MDSSRSFAEASPSSSSALPAAIDSLLPRGFSKAWKQAKSRAEVSMALLHILATSPVVALVPALIPPSPTSPSSAILLLHRSRIATPPRSSSKAHYSSSADSPFSSAFVASASSPSPSAPAPAPASASASASAFAAVASPSSSPAAAAAAASPSAFAAVASPSTPSRSPLTKLVGNASEPESKASEAPQCGRRTRRAPPCSTPCASSPFASVKTTHKIYLCTAWMFIWLWRLLRSCYNCLSGKQRASPSSAAVTAMESTEEKELAQPSPRAAASSPRPTIPRSKDLCAIAHNINSSSKHLKRKLRSSFKTLSVQVPRKAFAPLNHHFARLSPSSSATAIYSSSSPAPAPPSPAPALNPCKSSPLLSPCNASSPFNLRSGTPSTAHSPVIDKLPPRHCSNASDAFYYDTAPLSCSTSARSSISSCNSDHSNGSNTASPLLPSSAPISIEEQLQSAAPSLDSPDAIPLASAGSGIIAFFTICLALGGLIFGKPVAAIVVTGCWFLLRGCITSSKGMKK